MIRILIISFLIGADNVHGIIEIGLGLIEKDPRWSNFDGPEAIFRAPLPDIYSTMLHEMYHSLGLVSNNSQYKKFPEITPTIFQLIKILL